MKVRCIDVNLLESNMSRLEPVIKIDIDCHLKLGEVYQVNEEGGTYYRIDNTQDNNTKSGWWNKKRFQVIEPAHQRGIESRNDVYRQMCENPKHYDAVINWIILNNSFCAQLKTGGEREAFAVSAVHVCIDGVMEGAISCATGMCFATQCHDEMNNNKLEVKLTVSLYETPAVRQQERTYHLFAPVTQDRLTETYRKTEDRLAKKDTAVRLSFVAKKYEEESSTLYGTLGFWDRRENSATSCQVTISKHEVCFLPEEEMQVLPHFLSNEAIYQMAVNLVRTYLDSRLSRESYVWYTS